MLKASAIFSTIYKDAKHYLKIVNSKRLDSLIKKNNTQNDLF